MTKRFLGCNTCNNQSILDFRGVANVKLSLAFFSLVSDVTSHLSVSSPARTTPTGAPARCTPSHTFQIPSSQWAGPMASVLDPGRQSAFPFSSPPVPSKQENACSQGGHTNAPQPGRPIPPVKPRVYGLFAAVQRLLPGCVRAIYHTFFGLDRRDGGSPAALHCVGASGIWRKATDTIPLLRLIPL